MSNVDWSVLFVAGPSGVGKTRVSYQLADQFKVPLVEVDDLVHAVEAMTSPEQQPLIHYWRTHPEAAEMSSDQILAHHLRVCRALEPAISSVVLNHKQTRTPVVIDGDYVLPEFIAGFSGARAIFLYDEQDQIARNLISREPDIEWAEKRAEVSYKFGKWLQQQCSDLSLNAISARPWHTVLSRIMASFE